MMDPTAGAMPAQQGGPSPLGMPDLQTPPTPFGGPPLPVLGPDPSVVTLDQVMQLLHNDRLRGFRIDVETDSLVEADQQAEKQQRMEFVQAVGEFIAKTGPIAQAMPPLAPLLGDMLKFAVRGFKVGQEMEEQIETAMHKAGMLLTNPPPKQMPPEEQAKVQMTQMKAQAEIQKAQIGVQVAQIDGQSKVASSQAEVEALHAKHSTDLQAQSQKHETTMAQMQTQLAHDRERHQMAMAEHAAKMQHMQESHAHQMQSAQQSHEMAIVGKHTDMESKKQVTEAKAKAQKPAEKPAGGPKKIVRDAKGAIVGVEVGGKTMKAVRDKSGRIVAID